MADLCKVGNLITSKKKHLPWLGSSEICLFCIAYCVLMCMLKCCNGTPIAVSFDVNVKYDSTYSVQVFWCVNVFVSKYKMCS